MMWDFKQFASKVALLEDTGSCITYGELQNKTDYLASFIDRRYLVFSLSTNTIGSIIGYTCFLNNRIVPVLLNSQLDDDLLINLLELYAPAYLWVPQSMSSKFTQYDCACKMFGYVLLQAKNRVNCPLNDNLALLLTTSGSTGSPKFVRQSYKNVRINAEQISEYLKLDSSERPITTLPMNYTYGLSIINSHLLIGAEILLTDKSFMQREFWKFFNEAEATSFGGVPYTYEILEKLRFRRMSLPSLRYMTQAGGKLSPELHKKFAEYAIENNKKFIVMYGQCEATARMAYLPAEDSLRKYGSMGIAIPGGGFSLIDDNGTDITEAKITGELIYFGPNVTMGYAEKPEDLILGDVRNGRLETGDMAKRDEDGYYYIVGRKKRFLKIYGNRVNLDELDGLIKTQFGNVECTCGGIDDHAYIFITHESESIIKKQNPDADGKESLKKYASEKTGLNPAAFKVVIIPEIPKNDAGKVQYRELEKYYEL